MGWILSLAVLGTSYHQDQHAKVGAECLVAVGDDGPLISDTNYEASLGIVGPRTSLQTPLASFGPLDAFCALDTPTRRNALTFAPKTSPPSQA